MAKTENSAHSLSPLIIFADVVLIQQNFFCGIRIFSPYLSYTTFAYISTVFTPQLTTPFIPVWFNPPRSKENSKSNFITNFTLMEHGYFLFFLGKNANLNMAFIHIL